MSASIKALLFEAIECGWIGVIDSYLQRGGDPDLSFDQQSISCRSLSVSCKKGESIKLLHLAIATCTTKIDAEMENNDEWNVAVSLIDSLVEAGASLDATLTFEGKRMANVLVEEIPRVYLEYKPLHFARLLVQRGGINYNESSVVSQRLDSLYAKLVPKSPTSTPAQETIATVAVPQSVVDTYKKLLFSPECSDLKFVCEDGEAFPVHKNILAAASPDYFATAFAGPWKENNLEGEWHTSYPSSIIKAVITFVYTGEILDSLLEKTPIQILSIAGEFGFTSLKSLAAQYCIEALNIDEFKNMLQLAHLHNIPSLKRACWEFAKEHAVSVLTNSDVLSLPNEDSELWEEFKAAVAPDNS